MNTNIIFCDSCLKATPQRFIPAHARIEIVEGSLEYQWDVCHKCYWDEKDWLNKRGVGVDVLKTYYSHGDTIDPKTGNILSEEEEEE